MPGGKEFDKMLDEIPASYSYEAVQLLREAHLGFHQLKAASEVIYAPNLESLILAIQSSRHIPAGEVQSKVRRVQQIVNESSHREGNAVVLKNLLIVLKHSIPFGIDHPFED